MMCDARLFAPQLDALGGQVIVSTGQDTIAEMAENVLAQTPESFALAGLSMGGIIAMEVLRQAPDRVAKESRRSQRFKQVIWQSSCATR